MKRIIKTISALSLALLMVCAFSVTAFAKGTVTYDGNAQEFIFEKGSKYSPTDLFDGFKDVMPGDTLTQKVTVDNDISKNIKIKVYMRSKGAVEGSEDFLSQLNLTVEQEGKSELFDASADKKAGLKDWVCLGTIYSGGKIDLNLTLDVPAELGNEYQKAIGKLDWQFKVEELPIEKDDPVAPKTGETFNTALWVTILVVALLGIVLCFILGKKKKSDNDEN